MDGILYDGAALVDTAAVVSIFDEGDVLHDLARTVFFGEGQRSEERLVWYAVDTTSHESFTRVRYGIGHAKALAAYALLRTGGVRTVRFEPGDEDSALVLLKKYREHELSFQDALCAAIMRRLRLYKVFTFDRDFSIMGFEVIPGGVELRKRR